MVDLTHEQARMLVQFMSSASGILSQVDSASGPFRAWRDSLIDDAANWKRILLEKQRDSRGDAPTVTGATHD